MNIGTPELILDEVNIPSNTTHYTRSFDLGSHGSTLGIFIKAVSAAALPKFTVKLEESYKRPTTEGAADDDWAVPSSARDIVTNWIVETPFIDNVDCVLMKYARYKIITDAALHNDDTVFKLIHFLQEA